LGCKERTYQANWWWNYFGRIPTYVITIHQRYRQTDRRTDRRHAMAIPRFALPSRGKKLTKQINKTWKPSWRWQTRATRKHAENRSSSTWKQVADTNDSDTFCSKIACFPHPAFVWRPVYNRWKVHLMGYNSVADKTDNTGLSSFA